MLVRAKAPVAVGALGVAFLEARLPEERRLLISGHAGDGDAVGEEADPARLGDDLGVADDAGEDGFGNAEGGAQLGVPRDAREVHEQGARGVGGVGDVPGAAAQAMDEEAVDGAEGELALLRPRPRAFHVIEDPGDLGAGEVSVDDQTGLLADPRLLALGLELCTDVRGAAALPDDGAVDGHAALPVPQPASSRAGW